MRMEYMSHLDVTFFCLKMTSYGEGDFAKEKAPNFKNLH